MNPSIIAVSLLIVLLCTGCSIVEDNAWQFAQSKNTIAAYEEFLRLYPQSKRAPEARSRLEEGAWQSVQSKNTIAAYEEFLRLYPQSKRAPEARSRLEEGAWQSAQSKNTISAYEEFLRQYPQSKQAPEARSRLSKMPTFAKVVVAFPSVLKSRPDYYNISGPVWVFKITFREVNGIAAVVRSKRMRIYDAEGSVWGDRTFEDIFDSDNQDKPTIRLEPYGTGSYTSWVNDTGSPCKLCGAKMELKFAGSDERGKPINATVSFTLAR